MKQLVFVFPLIIFFLMQSVGAFPVSPPSFEIEFKPGLTEQFEYSVGNRGPQPLHIKINAGGDLNQYILLNQTEAIIQPGEFKKFNFVLALPQTIDVPGRHTNSINIEEILRETQGIGARVVMIMHLHINVPYPGKYLDMRFSAPDVNIHEDVNFELDFSNKGKETIQDIKGLITVFDSDSSLRDTIVVPSVSLEPGGSHTVTVTWHSGNFPIGIYHASANITYDGISTNAADDFRIGDLLVEIRNITYNKIVQNAIAKFQLHLISLWNENINDGYVVLELRDKGILLKTVRGESFSLEPYKLTIIPIFMETEGLESGIYGGKATVYYANKSVQQEFSVTIERAGLPLSGLTLAVIALSLLLIILIILNIIKLRKNR